MDALWLGTVLYCTQYSVQYTAQTWNLSQTLRGQDFSIISLPEKHVNYDKLTFATKQRILYIHIINHH